MKEGVGRSGLCVGGRSRQSRKEEEDDDDNGGHSRTASLLNSVRLDRTRAPVEPVRPRFPVLCFRHLLEGEAYSVTPDLYKKIAQD